MSKKGGHITPNTNSSIRSGSTIPKTKAINPITNGSRNSHFRMTQTDAKYGMLMWQSKLQEKMLQEKEKEVRGVGSGVGAGSGAGVSGGRRKSDEDYQQQKALLLQQGSRSMKNNTNTLESGTATTTTTTFLNRSNSSHSVVGDVGEPHTITFYNPPNTTGPPGPGFNHRVSNSNNGNSNANANSFSNSNSREQKDLNPTAVERNIEIFKDFSTTGESGGGGAGNGTNPDNPSQTPTPTPPTLVVTNTESTDMDAEIAAVLIPHNSNNNEMLKTNSKGALVQNQSSNIDTRMQDYNNYHYTRNNSNRGFNSNYHQQQMNKRPLPGAPVLPKIVPKLNTSVSCDNLRKNSGLGSVGFFSSNVGGAGAPRRSPSGRVMTNLQGHPDIRYHQKDTRGFDQTLRYMMDKEKINQYKEDLDRQLEEKQSWRRSLGSPTPGSVGTIKIMSSHDQLKFRNEESFYQHGNGGRDAGAGRDGRNGDDNTTSTRRMSSRANGNGTGSELIRKYKSLPRLNALNSTDVTKPFIFAPSPRRGDYNYSLSPEPEEIAKGLSAQLAEKQRSQHIQQENEKLAAERHFNTWDSFWGRPGHGAPMFYSRGSRLGASTPSLLTSRVDLFKALHMGHQQQQPNSSQGKKSK